MKKNSGLTLMEITIVLAIMAIVAMILVPVFLLTTDRARLRGDIQSAQIIQNALDLHNIERHPRLTGNDVNVIVQTLATTGYINPRKVAIQTEKAKWEFANGIIVVNIADSSDEVHRAFAALPENEQEFVRGGDKDR